MVRLGSVRTVACRSNFWPTKNRATMGSAWPELNSSLGGVKRDTVGAALAGTVSTMVAARVSQDAQVKVLWYGMDTLLSKFTVNTCPWRAGAARSHRSAHRHQAPTWARNRASITTDGRASGPLVAKGR